MVKIAGPSVSVRIGTPMMHYILQPTIQICVSQNFDKYSQSFKRPEVIAGSSEGIDLPLP